MSSSSSPSDLNKILVADASVVINLNATGCASKIVRALPGTLVVTDVVLAELAEGVRKGHADAEKVQALIRVHTVNLVHLGDAGKVVFADLVDGAAQETLDDGEASTLAYAQEVGGIALIDEQKARRICAMRFPGLTLASTIDVLTHRAVATVLGHDGQVTAILNALQVARMHVLPGQRELVRSVIGEEAAANWQSLRTGDKRLTATAR